MILLQGAGPIDCNPKLLSSYRPELGGITALLFLLTAIVKLGDITEGTVTLFCDNKSALNNIFDAIPRRGIYPLLEADYDLLFLAKDLLQQLPINVIAQHVKGHYKGDHREVQHDLNALADEIAEQFRKNPPPEYTPSTQPYFHPRLGAEVYSTDSAVTSKLRRTVYENLYTDQLLATIWKRNKWDGIAVDAIDWEAFYGAFRSYIKFKQIGVAKFIHGLWNTGYQKVLFKQEAHGLCPCCHTEQETTSHVFNASTQLFNSCAKRK